MRPKFPLWNYLGDYERMTGFSENEQRGKSNQIHPMISLKTCFWSNCEQFSSSHYSIEKKSVFIIHPCIYSSIHLPSHMSYIGIAEPFPACLLKVNLTFNLHILVKKSLKKWCSGIHYGVSKPAHGGPLSCKVELKF